MYTIITKEIDGLNIVLGIDTEKIDQIATMKKIKPFVESSTEYKAKKTRLDKIAGLSQSNASLDRQARTVINRASVRLSKVPEDITQADLTAGEAESLNKYKSQKVRNQDEGVKITGELPAVNEKLQAKSKELIKKHGVFFNLKSEYENTIDDETAIAYKKKLSIIASKKQFLLLDGSIIDDNRNKTFYAKIDELWEKIEVKLLSDTVDTGIYKEMVDLLEDEKNEIKIQFEDDRIAALTAEEKITEKNMILDSIMSQSVAMRSKLEIMGGVDALTKAQDFYNNEKIIVEEKYK